MSEWTCARLRQSACWFCQRLVGGSGSLGACARQGAAARGSFGLDERESREDAMKQAKTSCTRHTLFHRSWTRPERRPLSGWHKGGVHADDYPSPQRCTNRIAAACQSCLVRPRAARTVSQPFNSVPTNRQQRTPLVAVCPITKPCMQPGGTPEKAPRRQRKTPPSLASRKLSFQSRDRLIAARQHGCLRRKKNGIWECRYVAPSSTAAAIVL